MLRNFLVTLFSAAFLVAFAAAADAATTINSSKSNSFRTKPDCVKAGGKWWKGREGLGCYLPIATKPAPARKN